MSAHQRQPSAAVLAALAHGELEVVGQLTWSSNFTLLVNVTHDGEQSKAIYKPHDGEEPLWDFPDGLYRREAAAYDLAVALGWPNIPETIVRDDAPAGTGSLQHWIEADYEQHYFTFGDEHDDYFRVMATFDMIANNADRKGGHAIIDGEGTIWGIDHGLTFHPEPKLRTVIWDFGGEDIPAHLLNDIERVRQQLPESFATLLSEEERAATVQRMGEILETPRFPIAVTQRQYPWPLV